MSSVKNSRSHYTSSNKVSFILGGKVFFDRMLELINSARDSIHLQTYIFREDVTGSSIGKALEQAARRGVQVYLLLDGYASQDISSAFITRLQQAGVHFRYFEPLLKSRYYYFGRRLHQKLFVADTGYALVGGINISDHYNDLPGRPAWLDFAVYVEGSVAQQLCVLCWKTWTGFFPGMGRTPCELVQPEFHFGEQGGCLVSMRRNDWVRRKNEVSATYKKIFRQANAEVLLVSSYFLPGRVFRRNMTDALERGVAIKLILAGISDVRIAKQAERHMYRWLIKNNIEIYEYLPKVLHGKLAVCDDRWMTIGSYNFNDISAHASIELNLDIRNRHFVRVVRKELETILEQDCVRITADRFNRQNHFLQRAWQACCYQLILLILFLFTFYFKQRE